MNQALFEAIHQIHEPGGWVHLATTGKDGAPQVSPVMMGIAGDYLTFSLTGKQKKRNLLRRPRACVSIAQAGTLNHIIIWGDIELRHDAEAQQIWDNLIRGAFGDEGLEQRQRTLSSEQTSLGLMTPRKWRINVRG